MLHDDASILAYDISGRGLGGMVPSVEISGLVEDKEMTLKGITLLQASVFGGYHHKTAMALILDDASSVGQPRELEQLTLVEIIAGDLLFQDQMALLLP